MVKISVAEGCGNSPKNLFMQNMRIALTNGDQDFLHANLLEGAVWNIPGIAFLEGKENILTGLTAVEDEEVTELRIDHAFSHGAAGAVNGVYILRSGREIAFCDIFTFKSAGAVIVKSIMTYRVNL